MNDDRHCRADSRWSQLRAWHVMALALATVWLNVFEAPPLTLLVGMLLGWALFTTLLFVYYRETRGLAWLALACLVMSLLLFPEVATAEGARKIAQCGHNLRQIGIAIKSYHQEYNCFPPPYVADAEEKPLYSWRVLVLPYLGEEYILGYRT